MSTRSIVVTPSLFYQYQKCPNWIWHDTFSDPKTKGQYTELTGGYPFSCEDAWEMASRMGKIARLKSKKESRVLIL